EKRLTNWIDRKPMSCYICLCGGNIIWCRYNPALNCQRLVSLPFIEQEEKSLILHDRPTNVCVKLVIVNRRTLALPRSRAIVTAVLGEVIGCIAKAAVIDQIRPAMPIIGSTLHIEQNGRTAFDAKLGRRRLLNRELLDRIGRECNRGNSQDSSLVDSRIPVITIIIV